MATNRQDSLSVVCLLKFTIIVSIHIQFSFITELNSQSDNATTDQNDHLGLGIYIVNIRPRGRRFIAIFMHSETRNKKQSLNGTIATIRAHDLWGDVQVVNIVCSLHIFCKIMTIPVNARGNQQNLIMNQPPEEVQVESLTNPQPHGKPEESTRSCWKTSKNNHKIGKYLTTKHQTEQKKIHHTVKKYA